jgi:hypothetical protein
MTPSFASSFTFEPYPLAYVESTINLHLTPFFLAKIIASANVLCVNE